MIEVPCHGDEYFESAQLSLRDRIPKLRSTLMPIGGAVFVLS